MLVRVFFIRGLFVGRRWLFPLVLACSASSYEVAASTILQVISDFYLAVSSMDAPLFLQAGAQHDNSPSVGDVSLPRSLTTCNPEVTTRTGFGDQ